MIIFLIIGPHTEKNGEGLTSKKIINVVYVFIKLKLEDDVTVCYKDNLVIYMMCNNCKSTDTYIKMPKHVFTKNNKTI